MLTCMKPRLLLLQKSTNESAWGHTVPGLTSTSSEEQRRIRMRVKLKAINWSSSALGTENKMRFLGVVE